MSRTRTFQQGLIVLALAAAMLAGCTDDPTFRIPFMEHERTVVNPLGDVPGGVGADPQADALLIEDNPDVISRVELPGVVVETLRMGDGDELGAEDAAILRYRATLADGTLVDAASDPMGPWPLPGMVAGLREGLTGARVGAVRRITVQPDHAYGDDGVRDPQSRRVLVPPDTVVIYTIHLVGVVPVGDADE